MEEQEKKKDGYNTLDTVKDVSSAVSSFAQIADGDTHLIGSNCIHWNSSEFNGNSK